MLYYNYLRIKNITDFNFVLNKKKKNKLQGVFLVFDVLPRSIKMYVSLTINYIIRFAIPMRMIFTAVYFYAVWSFNFLLYCLSVKINVFRIQFDFMILFG